MGLGISGLLVIVGAAVALLVRGTAMGLNFTMVGVIVMVAGGMGVLTILAAWGAGRSVAAEAADAAETLRPAAAVVVPVQQ